MSVRRTLSGEAWQLVHPRCVRERIEDLEEVRAMIEAGEIDIAVDELRWLLSGCSDSMEAHLLLGSLALSEDHDLPLARGHFGYAYQLGMKALRRAGRPAPLPYRLPANRSFFEAGKGLAHCLKELGQTDKAREVLEELLRADPSDPLGLTQMRAQLSSEKAPDPDRDGESPQDRTGQD